MKYEININHRYVDNRTELDDINNINKLELNEIINLARELRNNLYYGCWANIFARLFKEYKLGNKLVAERYINELKAYYYKHNLNYLLKEAVVLNNKVIFVFITPDNYKEIIDEPEAYIYFKYFLDNNNYSNK